MANRFTVDLANRVALVTGSSRGVGRRNRRTARAETAQRGGVRRFVHAASKGASISDSNSLARDLGPRGIRVNCVAPGWVDTDMSADSLADPETRRRIESSIPLGRVASAEDIAAPILFLVSDLSRHVHGEVLSVSGGSVLIS